MKRISKFFCSQKRRSENEELYETNGEHNLFLNGSPLCHAGVGICISKALSHDILDVTFHAYSERFCALSLSLSLAPSDSVPHIGAHWPTPSKAHSERFCALHVSFFFLDTRN